MRGQTITNSKLLLDSGATTIYASKRWVGGNKLSTTKFSGRNIRVKLGDDRIMETELELLALLIHISGLDEAFECIAVVYTTPDEYDCILGIPFFEDMHSKVNWIDRRIDGTTRQTLPVEHAREISGPIEEGGPVNASGLQRSVEAKGLSAKRPDPRGGAALETDVRSIVELARETAQMGTPRVACEQHDRKTVRKGLAERSDTRSTSHRRASVDTEGYRTGGKDTVVEKIFTMGVADTAGVTTKYITRKKLRKVLKIKTKTPDEPDFLLVLSYQTIKDVAKSLHRRD
ncbi:hypothetical protein P3T76_001862 [Phytophthora citrophthora]|uniref:Uncharacterized protein n=1 Tax=Phytophthora citrophthora TaxID=4793 RepID=A0AAD9GXA7_9STRA|nr:hypothetical protein P3T76_001862 [Phytophthora citrophthora]